jgi:hypothetical protein
MCYQINDITPTSFAEGNLLPFSLYLTQRDDKRKKNKSHTSARTKQMHRAIYFNLTNVSEPYGRQAMEV